MKVEMVTKTNQKGQIVIPKAMREELGIDVDVLLSLTLRGNGIYIYPVDELLVRGEREKIYLEVLKTTQGAWAKEDWEPLRKKRGKIELSASKRRKQKW